MNIVQTVCYFLKKIPPVCKKCKQPRYQKKNGQTLMRNFMLLFSPDDILKQLWKGNIYPSLCLY